MKLLSPRYAVSCAWSGSPRIVSLLYSQFVGKNKKVGHEINHRSDFRDYVGRETVFHAIHAFQVGGHRFAVTPRGVAFRCAALPEWSFHRARSASPAVGFGIGLSVPGSDQLRHHFQVTAGQADAEEVEISARNSRLFGCLRGREPRELALFCFAVAADIFRIEIRDGVTVETPTAAGARPISANFRMDLTNRCPIMPPPGAARTGSAAPATLGWRPPAAHACAGY